MSLASTRCFSVLDLNDGIVSAAGIAEGFASAGASDSVLLVAAVATVLAGGLAAAGARYTEVRTEWEMNRALVEAERASFEADPDGEFEELVGIYQAKSLGIELARQVAAALTERDPMAAHADAELRLDDLDATSGGASIRSRNEITNPGSVEQLLCCSARRLQINPFTAVFFRAWSMTTGFGGWKQDWRICCLG